MPEQESPPSAGKLSVRKQELLLLTFAAVVVLTGGLIVYLIGNAAKPPLATCTSIAFNNALSQISSQGGVKYQLTSPNAFHCESGFAVLKVVSETAPGSGTTSDLDPSIMLFSSQDRKWQREDVAAECLKDLPQNISELACRP